MSAAPHPVGVRAGSPYWASLDGVRGLFMVSIFAYHAHPPLIPGAAISVDAFFVMSGFLITTLLVKEHAKTGGISLRRFYRRRVLRLFPAQFLVVPVAAVLAYWLIGASRPDVVPSARSVLLYYANFRAAHDPSHMSVFLPTWSLSTEEQFYVVWPVALLLLLRFKVKPWVLVGIVSGLLVTSTAWLQWSFLQEPVGSGFSAELFRPDLRIGGILVGTLCGLLFAYDLLPHAAGRVVRVCTAVGTAFVAVYLFKPLIFPRDVILTFAIVTACLCFGLLVLQQTRWPVAAYSAVLELRPIVWIGRASYVLYLLHVPALRLTSAVLGDPSWQLRALVGGTITLVVGYVVHEYVEKPALRFKDPKPASLGSST